MDAPSRAAGLYDGFELGYAPNWTLESSGPGSVETTTEAAREGTCSLKVTVAPAGSEQILRHRFAPPFQGTITIWLYFPDACTTCDDRDQAAARVQVLDEGGGAYYVGARGASQSARVFYGASGRGMNSGSEVATIDGPGWHRILIAVGATGARGWYDSLAMPQGHPNLRSVSEVSFGLGWSWWGTALFDSFSAIPPGGTEVVGWGRNNYGETDVPAGLSNVVAVAAGAWHSLAATAEGRVVAWGYNGNGQTTVPDGLTNAVAVAAGMCHSVALTADGRVVGWGLNGQAPAGLNNVAAVAAGGQHSLALTSDGRVTAWGLNDRGQTGVPAGLDSVVAVAAGEYHSLALKADGRVVVWGDDTSGQRRIPADLTNAVAVAAGDYHSLALTSEGRLVGWGLNTGGQTSIPDGLSNVVAMAAGLYHSVALTADGGVVGWGSDSVGQSSVPNELNRVAALASGPFHNLALTPPRYPYGGGVVVPGSTVRLAVPAMVGQAYKPDMRWFHNGTQVLAGVTGNALTLTDVQAPQLGRYEAVRVFGFHKQTNLVSVLRFAPDLRVASLQAPVDAFVGSSPTLTWTAANLGHAVASGPWVDRVYLSDASIVGGEWLVGEFPFTQTLATNQTRIRSQRVRVPVDLIPDRDYWWIVRTDEAGAIDEEDDANNVRVADAPVNVRLPPVPNLKVTSVNAPFSPTSGQPLTVQWGVTNCGGWSTGQGGWYDGVYLVTMTAGGTTTQTVGRVPSRRPLAVGEAYASSLTVTFPRVSRDDFGWWYIVHADVDNRVAEVTDDDNTAMAWLYGSPVVPSPDLQVTAVEAPSAASAGAGIAVAWTVTNAGTGVASEPVWRDAVYLSPSNRFTGTAALLGIVEHSGGLTNGGSYLASTRVWLPGDTGGQQYLLVFTDAGSNVFEDVDETNNVLASAAPVAVTPTAPPDLAVTRSVGPDTALAGRTLSVEYAVTNQGTGPARTVSWEDRLYLSPDRALSHGADILLASRWHAGGLPVGGAYAGVLEATLPNELSGTYYAVVVTDAGNAVPDANRTNNAAFSAGSVAIACRPADLTVTGLSAPATAVAGDRILVSWTVANRGSGETAAGRWTDRLLLSADGIAGNADDIALSTWEHAGSLAAGATYEEVNAAVRVPYATAPGAYRLWVLTDSGNAVYEGTNENNNASSPRGVTVSRETADLCVTGVAATNAALSEGTVTVRWVVRNVGVAAPTPGVWADAVYLATNAAPDGSALRLGTRQNPMSLAPGCSYTNSLAVQLPAEVPGTFFVVVAADADRQVIEDDGESNNTASATNRLAIALRPVPDLAVVSVGAPSDAYSGQVLPVTWSVRNNGPAAVGEWWYDAVYLSLDDVFDPESDRFVGYAERPHALTNGQTYARNASLRLPRDVAGLFRVFVVCDAGEDVYERENETNNAALAGAPLSVWLHPPTDLVVGRITIPTNAVAGREMAITYTLHNQSTNGATVPWEDSIYLSADEQWDWDDTLFARVSQTNVLLAGASRSSTIAAPLPGVMPGDYHVIVRTDIVNNVPETNEANNIGGSLDDVATEVTRIELGVPATNRIATGRALYYRVSVPAGRWLVIDFESDSGAAATEQYVRYGAIPTRAEFDWTDSNPLLATHRMAVRTRPGDYYILVYGSHVGAAAGVGCRVLAHLSEFLVFDRDYGRGGTAGNLTIEIKGVDLDRGCTAWLTNAAGVCRFAIARHFEGGVRFYPTFDLRGLTPGRYTVGVRSGEGASLPIRDSLEVVPGVEAAVLPQLSAPNAVRRNVAYQFSVQWANNSLNDAPAPLLTVGQTAPFGLSPGDYSLGTRYTFLGVNTGRGPPGILRPGQSESLTFHSFSSTDGDEYGVFADRVGKDPAAPMDWTRVQANLPGSEMARPNADLLFSCFVARIGPTWGDYLAMLSRNATLLPPGLGDNRSPAALERLEWNLALAEQTLSLSGRVTADRSDLEVGNVRVAARTAGSAGARVTRSLTDGTFAIPDVAAALFGLSVSEADGWIEATVAADTRAGESVADLALRLRSGADLLLYVSDGAGQPVEKAWVVLRNATNALRGAFTDWSGNASLHGLPAGAYTVKVGADAFAPFAQSVTLPGTGTVTRWLALSGGATIRGTVTVDGVPPPPARFFVLAESAGGGPDTNLVFAVTDADAFAFEHVAEGSYDVKVVSGTNLFRVGAVAVAEGQTRDLGRLEFRSTKGPAVARPASADCTFSHLDHVVLESPLLAVELTMRKMTAEILTTLFGFADADLWWTFLGAAPDCPAPEAKFGTGSDIVEGSGMPAGAGYRENPLNQAAFAEVLGRAADFLKARLELGTKTCQDMGGSTGKEMDIEQTGVSGLLLDRRDDLNYDSVFNLPGNTAGGYSGWNPDWCEDPSQMKNDTRHISGRVRVRIVGKNELVVQSRLSMTVVDAIDFHPGGMGAIKEWTMTGPLKFLESFGHAWGVPFTVAYDDDIDRTVTRTLIGLDCQKEDEPDPCDCGRTSQGSLSGGGGVPGGNGTSGSSGSGSQMWTGPADTCKRIRRPVSCDPNDIVGPAGFGPEQWIAPDRTLHYTIRFENDTKKAEVPAQCVLITQSLSTNLDLTTFRLNQCGFGSTKIEVPGDRIYYRTVLDATPALGVWVDVEAGLDLASGEVCWQFTSLDPATGDVPWDPFLGFLPPDTNGVVGQGFVSYTVRPRPGIAPASVVSAQARIFFDYNAPMDTPRIFNTLDGVRPSSAVLPLPAVTDRNAFVVRWGGADGYGESGVAAYDVYVSDNGGAWTPWLRNTASLDQTFVGRWGHTYQFYSVARDNVGNSEQNAGTAYAWTRVTAEASSGQALGRALGQTNWIWASVWDASWFRQTNVTHDGIDAAQSGPVRAGEESRLETVVSGPGMVGFWWKVAAATNDGLLFLIDAAPQDRIEGVADWERVAYCVPDGVHTLHWVYAKSPNETAQTGAAWVDEVDVGLWAGGLDAGNGWILVPWFGYMADVFAPWMWHAQFGWLYPIGETTCNLWLYSVDMGWLWTSEAIFPWCYGINVGSWLWYMRDTANPRWFYNFALQTWVTY